MQIKLLKISIEGIRLFKNEKFDVDFFTNQNVTYEEKQENVVEHLVSSLNKQNILAFVGINATGKTTTLKLIASIIEIFIQSESLNNISKKEVFELFKNESRIITHFFANNTIYKLTSDIGKSEEGRFYFKEEILQEKKTINGMSKRKMFDFDSITPSIQRTKEDSVYLKNDDSIFIKTLRKLEVKENQPYLFDMVKFNNLNYFHTLKAIPSEYIAYLDPNIEYLKFNYPTGSQKLDIQVQLKFRNNDMKEITFKQLVDYLSSGTIKGLYLLMSAQQALQIGGYMIIDEIENHLNKSIVITLLNLFKSKLNNKNASLIFTTHYSEILDDIDRNDCIYFNTKESGEIVLTNLATKYNRNDKKKSNIFLSGILGTAPQYTSYIDMKRVMNKKILD